MRIARPVRVAPGSARGAHGVPAQLTPGWEHGSTHETDSTKGDTLEPISLILLAISLVGGATAAAGIVVIAFLTIRDVLTWFRTRTSRIHSKDFVAATVLEHLSTGQYRTVQGIFNQRAGTWVEHRVIDSTRIDAELAALHRERTFVIHQI